MNSLRVIALLLALTAVSGCASHSGVVPVRDRSVITHELLEDARFSSAYDAVLSLRSNWMQARGVDSFRNPTQVQVYLDNVKLGGIEWLQTINVRSVSFIRHYTGIDASNRWGLGHAQGVIYVGTRPVASSERRAVR